MPSLPAAKRRGIIKSSMKIGNLKHRRTHITSNESSYSHHAKKYHGFYICEGIAPPLKTGKEEASARVLTIMDLFSGAGGFTLGFVQAGFVPIFSIEIDKHAAATYEANFGPHCLTKDINDVKEFPPTDIIIGGPPCQGFSNLGAHIPNDLRNQLWRHYMRAVKQVRPKVFVIENVPPLLSSEEGAEIVREATVLGYQVKAKILNAADYGAPQCRRRAIIIGSLIGEVRFPEATHVDPKKKDLTNQHLCNWVTVRQAIGDLPLQPTGYSWHIGRNPTEKSIKRYRHVPPGGNRWNLPKELMPQCWIRKTKGGTDLFGRLRWDAPSVTIRTEFFKPEKGRYLHPEAHRPITHREAARLQCFPDNFEWKGSKIEVAKQIGNAVPVQLAYAIGHLVKQMIIRHETGSRGLKTSSPNDATSERAAHAVSER